MISNSTNAAVLIKCISKPGQKNQLPDQPNKQTTKQLNNQFTNYK